MGKAVYNVTAEINKIVSSTGKISSEEENMKSEFTTEDEITTEMAIVAEENIEKIDEIQSDDNVATFLLPNNADLEDSSAEDANQDVATEKPRKGEIDVEIE